MREIGQNINFAKESVSQLLNVPVLVKIRTGKGKSTLCHGIVTALFPSVFSIKLENGDTRTFSYSDVHTKCVVLRSLKD